MEFRVACTCGGYVTVSEGAAGAYIDCACGRAVKIPDLARLRERNGLPAHNVSARFIIEDMLHHHELPTMRVCAHCHGGTEDRVEVTAECEKSWGGDPGWLASFFAVWFMGVWALLVFQRDRRERGDILILHLPVRMCRTCRRKLPRDATTLLTGLSYLVVVCGILGMLFLTPWVGLAAVGILLILGGVGQVVRQRQQAVVKVLLRQEPLYDELLRDYPDAPLLLTAR